MTYFDEEDNLKNFSTPLLDNTKAFVAGFIGEHFTEKICYHNIDHTMEVVEATLEIGHYCQITEEEMELVMIAAWFHDTGYYLGCENHEEASVNIAKDFLQNKHLSSKNLKIIIDCILATKVPQKPKNLLEKILCDADLYHLATDKFFEKSELLMEEFVLHNKKLAPESWMSQSEKFVQNHKYHTAFGKKFLDPKQQQNLIRLEQMLVKIKG